MSTPTSTPRPPAAAPEPPRLEVDFSDSQRHLRLDPDAVRAMARRVLCLEGVAGGSLSIAVVDDRAIHEVNRRHLAHDWPTDVLSFALDNDGAHLEGEIILSADTAARAAAAIGWPAAAEQLLYAIHGALHLVGYGDESAAEKRQIRAAEANYLRQLGFEQPSGSKSRRAAKRKPLRPSRPGAKLR